MAETGLGGLDVHTGGDEVGGVGSAEVVEREAVEAGPLDRRLPDPVLPVAVVERPAVGCGEQERLAARKDVDAAAFATCHLLGHDEHPVVEVDSTDP